MSFFSTAWTWYTDNRDNLTPIGALVGGGLVAWAALQQAATARRRHKEQTDADRQRRITESLGKAVEQLGSDKVEVRLGGIYGLERVSRESPEDFWMIMETLTAFVRERARWRGPDFETSGTMARFYETCGSSRDSTDQHKPPTDIAAVLGVIFRRQAQPGDWIVQDRGWRLDMSGVDLRGVNLANAPLSRAIFIGAHLEGANLAEAHLEGADLTGSHLQQANLVKARLEDADLRDAHLERATLASAHLARANLSNARLDGATLWDTHLEGADLTGAVLEDADLRDARVRAVQLKSASGNAATQLPIGMERPPYWE